MAISMETDFKEKSEERTKMKKEKKRHKARDEQGDVINSRMMNISRIARLSCLFL